MKSRSLRARVPSVAAGALAILGVTVLGLLPVQAQTVSSETTSVWARPPYRTCPPPCPPPTFCPPPSTAPTPQAPGQPTAPGTPTSPEAAAQTPPEPSLSPERAGAVGGESVALAAPNMLGDQLGSPTTIVTIVPRTIFINGIPVVVLVRQFSTVPPQTATALVPTLPKIPGITHSFKISENESPEPQNRVYFDFNYYNDVFGSTNRRLGADIGRVDAYREMFGLEKTFLNGDASVELRVPLNTLHVNDGFTPGTGGDSTDMGDLSVIFKYALWRDPDTRSLVSAGFVVTAPTGSSTFGGFPSGGEETFHETLLSPFVGFRWNRGDLFVQGFTSANIPTDSNDVTLYFNDLQIGYYVMREHDCDRWLTALAPVFEVHVNTPLNHRGVFNGPIGAPDVVDFTTGLAFEIGKRSSILLGVVTPVTGPRPFDVEALAYVNFRF